MTNVLKNSEVSPVKLKRARGQRSPSEVAEAVGISRQHLWMIENDKCTPNADIIARLCWLYGVGITDLLRTIKTKAA